jgi:hypothetical protein
VDAYARAVEEVLTGTSAVVSSLWAPELANTLLIGERHERPTEAEVTAFLAILGSLPSRADDETAGRAWNDPCRRLGHVGGLAS